MDFSKKKELLAFGSALLSLNCGSPKEKYDTGSPEKNPNVIFGTEAEHSQFPSVVALTSPGGEERCSGTLIKPDFVITAAHCIPPSPIFMRVVYGASDINQGCDDCVHEIAAVKAHLGYNPFTKNYGHNDIGWILLKRPIKDAVTAEILPESKFKFALHLDDLVNIAGYGLDHNWNSGVLNYAEVPIIDFYTADGPLNNSLKSFDEKSQPILEMVVGSDETGASNLCYGDSGGPTYVEYEGSVYLTGVTSRIPPDKPIECGHGAVVGLPGHYQRLTELVYAELRKCRDKDDCGESIGTGNEGGSNSGHGEGGNDVPEGYPAYTEPSEPLVILDRSGCNYSGKKENNLSNNFNYGGYVSLLSLAALLALRRSKD